MGKKNSLFDPPTPEELAALETPKEEAPANKGLFAPPTAKEMPKAAATPAPAPMEPIVMSTPTPEFTKLESAGLGALQGGTFGLADEGEGAIRGGLEALSSDDKLVDLYRKYRDLARMRDAQAKEANPKSYLAGNVAGGAVTAAAIPGSSLASLGRAVATGVGTGAASALGSSTADLTTGEPGQYGQALTDTVVGGAIGGALSVPGHYIAKSLSKPELATRSAANANKALGIKPKGGPQSNLDIGATVLDEGALPLTGGSEQTARMLGERISEGFKTTQPILQRAQQNIQSGKMIGQPVTVPVANRIENALGAELRNLPQTGEMIALGQNIERNLYPWIQQLRKAGSDPVKLDQAKKGMYETIKQLKANAYNTPDNGAKVEIYKKINSILRGEIEGVVGTASGAGDEAVLAETNQVLSKLIKAKSAVEGPTGIIAQDLAKKPGSLSRSDLPAGTLAAAAYALNNPGIAAMMIGAGGVKLATEAATKNPIGRLANIATARTQRALMGDGAQMAINAGKNISQAGVQSGIQSIYRRSPEQLRAIADMLRQEQSTANLGDALTKALDSDDSQTRDSVLFALEQNPNTRMRLKSILGNGEDNG